MIGCELSLQLIPASAYPPNTEKGICCAAVHVKGNVFLVFIPILDIDVKCNA